MRQRQWKPAPTVLRESESWLGSSLVAALLEPLQAAALGAPLGRTRVMAALIQSGHRYHQ